MSDKMREEFEAWAASELLHGKVTGEQIKGMREGRHYSSYNQYTAGVLSGAWHGWAASRAALVVELPDSFRVNLQECFAADEVIDAIHATGVTTK